MDFPNVRIIKQACSAICQRLQRPSRDSLHALLLISRILTTAKHVLTLSNNVLYSPIGYMHSHQSHATPKATKKRLPLAKETSLLPGYTPSHQKYSSQEVTR